MAAPPPALGAQAPSSGPAPSRAAAAGTTPVSFQGSALLITYYSGVAEALLEKGVIVPGETPLSGLSGGAWTSVATQMGLRGEYQKTFWKGVVTDCTARWGSCVSHINAGIEACGWPDGCPACTVPHGRRCLLLLMLRLVTAMAMASAAAAGGGKEWW